MENLSEAIIDDILKNFPAPAPMPPEEIARMARDYKSRQIARRGRELAAENGAARPSRGLAEVGPADDETQRHWISISSDAKS